MKIIIQFLVLNLFFLPTILISQTNIVQDSTGLPGDHFSLEGALELFKKAESPEDFEKLLNKEDNHVNNLDLNEDGEIDYIRVVDNMDGDVHAIALQVPVSETESQDVAVIEIELQGKEEAILQIVGDEILYGKETIVEPFDIDAKDDGRGPSVTVERIVFNVYFWPSVRYVYRPGYRVYVSPYRWSYYPVWWSPWRPHPWRVHHSHVVVYRPHYRVASTHRVVHAHRVYTPHRRTSKVVHTRTVSRTTVQGRNGGTVTRKTTTKGVGAKGRNGTAGAKKSTTTTTLKGRNGGTVTKKKQTTAAGKKGKRGTTGGKRTKTTVKKKRGG